MTDGNTSVKRLLQQNQTTVLRRVGEVSKLMVDAGLIVLVSFISPFRSERLMARELLEAGEFIEVYVSTPLTVAEKRDPKGLYAKARRGEIKNFTGISSPYEEPDDAAVRVETSGIGQGDGSHGTDGGLGAIERREQRCDPTRAIRG